MIGYTPSRPEHSGGITGTLGLHAWGAGAAGTELDVLVSQGAVVSRAYSVRKLRTVYAGQCCRLRGNGTGNPEADISFTTAGALDKSAVATLISNGSGTAAYWKTFYDQSGNGTNAIQINAANQVKYGEGVFSTGAMGDLNSPQTNCWLDFSIGAMSAPCGIWAVCSMITPGINRNLVGYSNSSVLGLWENPFRNIQQSWGTVQSTNSAPAGLVNILGVCNGASSKVYVGGTLVATGNAGSGTGAGIMRLGAAAIPANYNWCGTSNQTIAEVIVFGSDPTGLAGWPAFVAATKSYFGTS